MRRVGAAAGAGLAVVDETGIGAAGVAFDDLGDIGVVAAVLSQAPAGVAGGAGAGCDINDGFGVEAAQKPARAGPFP